MRFIVHVSLPVEKFNQALRDGTAAKKMTQILEDTKPEAAYFCAKDGKRGGYLVVNMQSTAEMPRYAEPWFINFDAAVEFLPCMLPEDLRKANLDEIARKWT